MTVKLASTYGNTWHDRTPSWSQPKCRLPGNPTGIVCQIEWGYGGVSRSVAASVVGGAVTLYPIRHWVRRLRGDSTSCTHQSHVVLVGQLSSNDGGCDALIFYQNFGYSGRGKYAVRYTDFKREIFLFGTDSALWPDFFLFHCSRSTDTYQCLNRFGDGLRGPPYAGAAADRGSLHLGGFFSPDRMSRAVSAVRKRSASLVAERRRMVPNAEPPRASGSRIESRTTRGA